MVVKSKNPYLNSEIVVELLPTFVFFFVNYFWDFRTATIVTLIASVLAVAAGLILHRKLPLIAIAAAVITLCLGGASLIFDNEDFVKMRPTVGKLLFAAALFVGMYAKPTFLERVLGNILSISTKGWAVLHYSWIGFGLLRAAANEIVWRMAETDSWVLYKTLQEPVSIAGYILITRFIARRYWVVVWEDATGDK